MPEDDARLAEFQAKLLNLLHTHESAEQILPQLLEDPNSSPYLNWLQQIRPEMLEVGAVLVKKWGRFS